MPLSLTLSTFDPTIVDSVLPDIFTIQATVNKCVYGCTDKAITNHWGYWCTFCSKLVIDLLLNSFMGNISTIQVFDVRCMAPWYSEREINILPT